MPDGSLKTYEMLAVQQHKLACKLRVILTLIISFLIIRNLSAQYQNLTFEHLSTPQGLSQDIVRAIVQDHYGFMWFGTEDGLNRYDGYSIKVYKHDPRDSTTLSVNAVSDIYEDTRGRLWIATDKGLNLYDRNSDRFIRIGNDPGNEKSLSNNGVFSIRGDRRGRLWIATAKGLNRYDEDRQMFVRYFQDSHNPNSINSDAVMSLLFDRKGTLWISTTNGICKYNEASDNFTRYLFEQHTSSQRKIMQLHEDRTGRLWAIQADHGVWCFDVVNRTFVALPQPTGTTPANVHEIATAVVNNIAEDTRGNLWIGHLSGLDLFDPQAKTFTHYSPDPMNPAGISGRVIVVYRDRVGVMWLGTFQGGVDRCDPNRQKFLLYTSVPTLNNGLSSNYVTAVYEDKAGYVWIGTDGGLDRFDPRSHVFTHYRHNPHDTHSIGGDQINALFEDRLDNLWIGAGEGANSSLDCLDRERKMFTHYPITSVKSILEDSKGNLWVGKINESDIGEDLVLMDRNRNILSRDTLAGTGVWCIYEDRQGAIWFGGQYCCLNRFDATTNKFTLFPHTQTGLRSGAVRSVFEDDDGYFWFATWGGGLNRYNPGTNTFSFVIEQDGLPSNYVKGILPDDHGNLWISTEKGLSRFEKNSRTFRNYTIVDGLQGERFLSNSCFKGKNGWMYFGGTNGLNIFHPDSIKDNPNIPPIVITSFKVFDKPFFSSQSVSDIEKIHLAYDQDFFSFEFVALDYTAPLKNQYAYKLEGFDRNWVEAGTRRYAAYTRLSPGEYTFRVRGSNNDGVWNNEGASIKLIIAPPFWQTWWFIILSFIIIGGVLYIIYHYQINQLLAIERLRARIASDLHDDVGTDLSSIVLATHAMEHKLSLSPQQQDEVRQIGRIALRTQDMMRDIVWVLNSRNDSLTDIILKMREITARMLKEISYTFKGPDSPLSEKVSLEFKRTIFLFYKECLHNIIKHSAATEVKIEIQIRQGEFVLNLADNGKGFNPDTPNTGIGLQNMKSRAEHIGGNLTISSAEGTGTKINLTVKTT